MTDLMEGYLEREEAFKVVKERSQAVRQKEADITLGRSFWEKSLLTLKEKRAADVEKKIASEPFSSAGSFGLQIWEVCSPANYCSSGIYSGSCTSRRDSRCICVFLCFTSRRP